MDGVGSVFLLFTSVIVLGLLVYFAAAGMDRVRIQEYFRHRGEQLLDLQLAPFGPGWFGEGSARIYHVRFRDGEGRTYSGYVKTSMWSGVYLTGDRVVSSGTKMSVPGMPEEPPLMTQEEIEREKARLRKRLAELEQMSARR